MSTTGGLPRAVERAHATGCKTLQIFTKSGRQWRARPLPKPEIDKFRQLSAELDVQPAIAHASYLINLGSPDNALQDKSRNALGEELDRAEALGLLGLVLHPGSYTTTSEEEGLARIAEGIVAALSGRQNYRTTLLLEHTAGQGTNLGYTFEQLGIIITEAERNSAPRIGACLDTCHLLAAGYDLSSDAAYAKTMTEFDRHVGIDRLRAIHLNDSEHPLASRKDRHAHIGRGHVGLSAFRRLLADPRLQSIPMVLETPKTQTKNPSGKMTAIDADPMDLENLRTLRELLET